MQLAIQIENPLISWPWWGCGMPNFNSPWKTESPQDMKHFLSPLANWLGSFVLSKQLQKAAYGNFKVKLKAKLFRWLLCMCCLPFWRESALDEAGCNQETLT